MRIRSGGDVDDDLGVGFCERGNEWRAEEGAAGCRFSKSEKRLGDDKDSRDVLHAFRAAPFVAVVEVEAFALEDERTYAILRWWVSILRGSKRQRTYLGGRCRS